MSSGARGTSRGAWAARSRPARRDGDHDHLRRRTPRGPGPAAQLRGRGPGPLEVRVKQIVFVAFSRDELEIGFGFPKAERDGLVASDPETFFLPPTSDLRYQWVCAHLARLDEDEMRELVVDAWRTVHAEDVARPAEPAEALEPRAAAAAVWNAI